MPGSNEELDLMRQRLRSNPRHALKVAERNEDFWPAAQWIAWVARFAPADVAADAFASGRVRAAGGEDDYQRSGALAWLLRAAIEIGTLSLADELLVEALASVSRIENTGSRAGASELLFRAASVGGARFRRPVVEMVQRDTPPDGHWRAERLYRDLAAMLAGLNADEVGAFVDGMPIGKARTRVVSERARGITYGTGEFFR